MEGRKTLKGLVKQIEDLKQENIRLVNEFKQQKKIFQKIIDSIPAVIFWIDNDHKLLGFNREYVRTVKVPRSKLLGKKVYEHFPDAKSIKTEPGKAEKKIIRTAESKCFNIIKIPFDNNTVYVTTDITEAKKAEDELGKYKQYLEEMAQNRLNEIALLNSKLEQETLEFSKAKEELGNCSENLKTCEGSLGDCEHHLEKTSHQLTRHKGELEQINYASSHFFQEPLRLIVSYSQLLQKRYKGKLDRQADDFISYLVSNALRINNLINDHINLSKISLAEKNYELTDLNQVVESVIQEMTKTIKIKKAKITFEPLPEVMADRLQMLQLFENIIGNAVKFEGSKSPEVRIKAEKKGNEYVISVRDNGMGLEKEYFDRIFIMFNRLHTDEKYPGTGIGLTICKSIVQGHGGKIWVESSRKEGSTFYFTIPVNSGKK
jgi:K+-sensing histidine kinase KdpD